MQNETTLAPPLDNSKEEGRHANPLAMIVLGATAGAVGTWALDRADWFMWDHEDEEARQRTRDVRPNGEPPAHIIARKAEGLLQIKPSREQHAATGQAVHFGLGILPAIAYAFVREKLPGRGIMRGLLFGGSMFVMQDEMANSLSGLAAKPGRYPWQAHARGLVAHLLYGVTTELALNAMEKSGRRLAGNYAR